MTKCVQGTSPVSVQCNAFCKYVSVLSSLGLQERGDCFKDRLSVGFTFRLKGDLHTLWEPPSLATQHTPYRATYKGLKLCLSVATQPNYIRPHNDTLSLSHPSSQAYVCCLIPPSPPYPLHPQEWINSLLFILPPTHVVLVCRRLSFGLQGPLQCEAIVFSNFGTLDSSML